MYLPYGKKIGDFSSVMLVLWGVSKIVGPYHGFALLSETVKFLMFENLRHPARGLVFKVYVLMAQIPNLSFGLWMSIGEITYPAPTTSEKKKKNFEQRRSYFWLEDFVEFEAFVPPFCWVEARGLVNMVKFGIAFGIFLLRSVIISATEECDDSDLDVFFWKLEGNVREWVI